MFDLQRFDDSGTATAPAFGLLSAADKAKIENGGFCSVSVNGAFAYFYKTPEPTGTPDYTLRLIDGALPVIGGFNFREGLDSGNTALTATNGTDTIHATTSNYANLFYNYLEVTSFGRWTVSGGGVSYVYDINKISPHYDNVN